MKQYYEFFKILLIACAISGIFLRGTEKIFPNKCVILAFKSILIIPATFLPMYMFFSIRYFIIEPKFTAKLYGLAQCVYGFYSSFVILSSVFIKNDFVRAFELWDSLFKEDIYEEDREELLKKKRKVANAWIIIFGSLSVFGSAVYPLFILFNEEKTLGHPSGIPYRHQSPDFELAVFFELIAVISGWTTMIAYDSIVMILLSVEECQLLHLKRSLGRIIEAISINDNGHVVVKDVDDKSGNVYDIPFESLDCRKKKSFMTDMENKIRLWVSQHQQVLRFHRELQDIFAVPLTVKYLAFTLLICLTCFLFITDRSFSTRDKFVTVIFLMNNYSLFYVNTTKADAIAETGQTIFDDAFVKSWHVFPKKMKTRFMIIAMRSNCPVQFLAARTYRFSSRTFLKVFTSAYSFFTFLLHIMRRNPQPV